ncbi:MAG TPA: PAS domain S-box protein, partial [Thermoanaerobaculia bacterium]|nr:PAS domain S-box protein [Thermoanaerobaculia bacterium]
MPFSRPPGDPFRAIAESSPDAVICIDSSNAIVFWNASAEIMFGYRSADAVGKPLTMIISEEYRAAHERILGKTLAMRALRSDGTIFPIELSLSAWNDGHAPFFTGIIRDVSERVAWTDLLRTSEDDHRRLFEYAHDAILVLDPVTEVVLAANRRAGELYGMNHRELIGLSMETFSVDIAEGKSRIFETLGREGRHLFSTQQRRKDGTIIELEIAAAITHYQGSDAILSINRDVTVQNIAQRGLARERDFVSKVLEVAGSLVIVLDTEGRILRFNRACEIASGYSAGEIMGKSWDVLLFAEEQEETRAEFIRWRSGVGASTFENRLRTKDGLPRQISWSSTSL